MGKYLAYDSGNGDYEKFDTIEEAREWLVKCFLYDNTYSDELTGCKIYEIKETVGYDVIDKKSNYKYECEEDIPEDDEDSEAWPYHGEHDEIWKHKFIPVN